MKEVLEKLKEHVESYMERDFLEKCRQMYREKERLLTAEEKDDFFTYLAGEQHEMHLLKCIEGTDTKFSVEDAKKYSMLVCSCVDPWKAQHIRVSNFVLEMENRIDASQVSDYYSYILEMTIKYGCICALQNLLNKDKELHFISKDLSYYEPLLAEQPDMRIADNVRRYLTTGEVGEDWMNFVESHVYKPDIYVEPVDYFKSTGKEICKENLKSYKKSKLLSKNTTLEELDAFVDQYNWDDGVEIPYFIMHHKNCDLALRKKLFELGAGDCIDEKTYVDTKKDPWKQFILELKEMIEKEEK